MVESIGRGVIHSAQFSWDFFHFAMQAVVQAALPPYRGKETLRQLSFVAVESAPVVVFCVSFAAVVTIIESAFHMKIVVKNDALVPGFAALLILRELGAVLTALLITSRVGAGFAAEVGSMKVTEQIDALKMLGIDPVSYLVVPRWIACILGGVLLTIIANAVCLMCAMLVSQLKLGYSYGASLMLMRSFVSFQDLVFSLIKGACFGAAIPLFSCFYGLSCNAGAESVGRATTNSVVSTSVAIILIDFILTFTFSYFY